MFESYRKANEKITASPQLRAAIIGQMCAGDAIQKKPILPRSLAYAAIAAALVLVVLGVTLIPKNSVGSFTVTAAEIELNGDGYEEIVGGEEFDVAQRLAFRPNSDGTYTFVPEAADYGLGMGFALTDNGIVNYIGLPLRIEGRDIDTITYEAEGGALCVSKNSDKLIEGSAIDRSFPDTPLARNYGDPYSKALFTFDRQFDREDAVYILVIREFRSDAEREIAELFDRYISANYANRELIPYEEYTRVMNACCAMAFDDFSLRVTVRYHNGEQQSKVIRFCEKCDVSVTTCTGDMISYDDGEYTVIHDVEGFEIYHNVFSLLAKTED